MDDLVSGMEDAFALSENNIYGSHPHFSDYKNEGKISARQRIRREEYLQRQAKARDFYFEQIRAVHSGVQNNGDRSMEVEAVNDSKYCNKLAQLDVSKFKGCIQQGFEGMDFSRWSLAKAKKHKYRYTDVLMYSEWLVDIPCHLDTEWIMLSCPVGKRCLLVAQNGYTSIYNKTGYRLSQLQTDFPGGNCSSMQGFTMLDCIFDKSDKKYYILDMICWGDEQFSDREFVIRRDFLINKFAQMPGLSGPGPDGTSTRFSFHILESCECNVEAMNAFMQSNFSYTLDGLLFYYSKVFYTSGQTPLVGWLKPWMLPEILGVRIPMNYTCEQGFYTSTRHFIDRYNEKHHFKSSIVKCDDAPSNGLPAANSQTIVDKFGRPIIASTDKAARKKNSNNDKTNVKTKGVD